jgi:hypothetical protein
MFFVDLLNSLYGLYNRSSYVATVRWGWARGLQSLGLVGEWTKRTNQEADDNDVFTAAWSSIWIVWAEEYGVRYNDCRKLGQLVKKQLKDIMVRRKLSCIHV